MPRFYATFIMAALVLLPASAGAATERLTAAELAGMCNSTSDVDYGFCGGYVTAIADAMAKTPGTGACHHAHVRSQQYIEVFRAYAELYPEKMHGEAKSAVAASLARAFPCR